MKDLEAKLDELNENAEELIEMKHRAFLANLQEEKESHKLEVDGVKKVFRDTVLEKAK